MIVTIPGVVQMTFSPDGRYLAVRTDNLPAAVFVWNVTDLSLEVVMVHRQKVAAAQWSPTGLGEQLNSTLLKSRG